MGIILSLDFENWERPFRVCDPCGHRVLHLVLKLIIMFLTRGLTLLFVRAPQILYPILGPVDMIKPWPQEPCSRPEPPWSSDCSPDPPARSLMYPSPALALDPRKQDDSYP